MQALKLIKKSNLTNNKDLRKTKNLSFSQFLHAFVLGEFMCTHKWFSFDIWSLKTSESAAFALTKCPVSTQSALFCHYHLLNIKQGKLQDSLRATACSISTNKKFCGEPSNQWDKPLNQMLIEGSCWVSEMCCYLANGKFFSWAYEIIILQLLEALKI